MRRWGRRRTLERDGILRDQLAWTEWRVCAGFRGVMLKWSKRSGGGEVCRLMITTSQTALLPSLQNVDIDLPFSVSNPYISMRGIVT